MSARLHGLVAVFATPGEFLVALRGVRESGYAAVEVNVPFAIAGMDAWLPGPPSPVAAVVLAAGLAGGAGGYFLQWYAAHDYPLNAGGRPLHSWPAFVPVTFELTVLAAALAGVAALFWLCRLPRLDHPLFAMPGFARASQDRYCLGVRADDPHFHAGRVRALLESFTPELLEEVHA